MQGGDEGGANTHGIRPVADATSPELEAPVPPVTATAAVLVAVALLLLGLRARRVWVDADSVAGATTLLGGGLALFAVLGVLAAQAAAWPAVAVAVGGAGALGIGLAARPARVRVTAVHRAGEDDAAAALPRAA